MAMSHHAALDEDGTPPGDPFEISAPPGIDAQTPLSSKEPKSPAQSEGAEAPEPDWHPTSDRARELYGLPPRLDIRRMLTTPAPEYDFVLPGLPLGRVGLLPAPGGVGKSRFALQLAIDIATGATTTWPEGVVAQHAPAPVMILAAEDHETDIHIRLGAAQEYLRLTREQINIAHQNLDLRLVPGWHLIDGLDEGRLGIATALAAEQTKPRLIIADPLSRLASWTEVDSRQATKLIETIEWIARVSGASILVIHHVSKAAIRNGELSAATSARGSQALTDGVRMQCALVRVSEDTAAEHGIPQTQLSEWRKFVVTKSNYAREGEPVWFRQDPASGFLAPQTLSTPAVSTTSSAARKGGGRRATAFPF